MSAFIKIHGFIKLFIELQSKLHLPYIIINNTLYVVKSCLIKIRKQCILFTSHGIGCVNDINRLNVYLNNPGNILTEKKRLNYFFQ